MSDDDKIDDKRAEKFTYKEGDLKLIKRGTGPTIEQLLKEQERKEREIQEILNDPDYGRPDPGFRAPRPPR